MIVIICYLVGSCNDAIVSPRARHLLNVSVILILLLGNFAQPELRSFFFSSDTDTLGYRSLGLWDNDRFPAGTVVGGSQTGGLGYFAEDLIVVNLDGVVNNDCFEALQEKMNMEYIRRVGVRYIVGWPINIRFIEKETADFRADDLIPLGKIEGFRSWGHEWYLYEVNYHGSR